MEKQSDLWQTPQEFFDKLNEFFKFDYDVCANENNKLAPFKGDYFINDFSNCTCYMNPPYSNPSKFVNRALELIKNNVTTVCLLKSDTGTKLFHSLYNNPKVHIEFIKGRIKFLHPNEELNKNWTASFPALLAIIRP